MDHEICEGKNEGSDNTGDRRCHSLAHCYFWHFYKQQGRARNGGGGNEASAVEVHVSFFVVVFDLEMIPVRTFILKNVNPTQEQKLQS